MEVDLLAALMQPPSSEFASVLTRYRSLLAKLADLSGTGTQEITAARITVDFAPPPWPRAIYYKAKWGAQFILTVSVCAGGRADGIVRHAGYCRRHNPASERQSTRLPDAERPGPGH